MGEYAIRKSDGTEVKIGTCESMYYLRFEDRYKVTAKHGNVDPVKDCTQIRFRLPFPDEDAIEIGQYGNHERGQPLYKPTFNLQGVANGHEEFADASTVSDPGMVQLTHACGLLLNVPCYHGQKLPELGDRVAHWNGKSWFLELYQLRPILVEGVLRVLPVVHCRFCGHAWRYQWADVLDYIPEPMRSRLAVYAESQSQVA
jgi:hypothetical protein